MTLTLFNTLGRQVEPFDPPLSHTVRMYTCGPTVYNHVHIGNWRAYIFADVLKRYIEYKGYRVHHVMNMTDVDDKTIRGANERGTTLDEYTRPYKDIFLAGLEQLGMERPDDMPSVTEHIDDILAFIQRLVDSGHAYVSDGSVYFRIATSDRYGELALLDKQHLRTCAHAHGNDADEYDKEDVGDFVLWKGWKQEDGDIYWESPFGKGRPGWHIECTVLATKYLGDEIDIHTGGIDLIFPHHTNEIAQTEAVTEKRFSKFWLHNAHLIVDGVKMSKSLGNFLTLRDLYERSVHPIVIRFLLLRPHFQSTIDLSEDLIADARTTLAKFVRTLYRLESTSSGDGVPGWDDVLARARVDVESALDENLNTFAAIQALIDLEKQVRETLPRMTATQKRDTREFFEAIDRIFSVFLPALGVYREVRAAMITPEVQALAEERMEHKSAGRYDEADALRMRIESFGVTIRDVAHGFELDLDETVYLAYREGHDVKIAT